MSATIQLLDRSPPARINLRLPLRRPLAPVAIAPKRPVVTFSFDATPRSAVVGAEILERFDARGGFYVATSLLGRRDATFGDMIRKEDLAYLSRRGHEIGAHTHTQLDCSAATPEVLEADLIANYAFLRASGVETPPLSFAFPFGESNPQVRSWAAQRFAISRGCQPGVNVRLADRSQLRSTLLTSQPEHRERARKLIAECVKAKGWLIFNTHDVRSAPSTLGVSLRHLIEVVQIARDGGADVLAPYARAQACGVVEAARTSMCKWVTAYR